MSRCIVLIRHAEKPRHGEPAFDAQGGADAQGLTIRGWQRAGALVPVFAGRDGRRLDDRLPRPSALFAAADAGRSRRPEWTLQPLAAALGLPIALLRSEDSDASAPALLRAAAGGPLMVCWRHRELPLLARALGCRDVPAEWGDDCYDRAWVCTQAGEQAWRLQAVVA